MNPLKMFCLNPDCPAKGQTGKGNIVIHSRKNERYKCKECEKTFTETKGTVRYRRKIAAEIIVYIVTLMAYGCPVQAIVAAFKLDPRTVRDVFSKAGGHCRDLHRHLVETPRDLKRVQADEIKAKTQGGCLWIAMAIMDQTRLWLGGVVSPRRDRKLIDSLCLIIARSAVSKPLLIVTDGLKTYVNSIRRVFSYGQRNGRPGRPRLIFPKNIMLFQLVKSYTRRGKRFVCKGTFCVRTALGKLSEAASFFKLVGHEGLLHTSYIERLNATFRSRLFALCRRSRSLLRRGEAMESGVYLVGTVYNFCSYHRSLGVRRQKLTPAMASGITERRWEVKELLNYRVPPPYWEPPKKRGRKSTKLKELIAKWCDHT